ncbi:hypothetical protein ACSEM9_18895 [Acinetobacter baumannii]
MTLQQFNQMHLSTMHQKALSITEGLGTDLLLKTIFSEEFNAC